MNSRTHRRSLVILPIVIVVISISISGCRWTTARQVAVKTELPPPDQAIPSDGDGAFERALLLAAEERDREAREVLDPLLQRDPDHTRARLLHGVLRAREGRVGHAIEIFETLRRDNPDMSEPYNNLAVLYTVEGRLDDARRILLESLERRPDAVTWVNLGEVYAKLAHDANERARELDTGVIASPRSAAAPEPGNPVTTPSTMAAGARAPNTRTGSARGAATETIAAASKETSTPGAFFCADAGGFQRHRAAADAARWLQSFGAEVIEVRREERRIAGRYRVYLPPFESRRQADAKLREIRNRGVRDVAVIPDGDLANGITFGVYRNPDNVHRRVAALEELGHSVRSRAADEKVVGVYVIRARAGGSPATLDLAWTSQFPGQSIRVVDCG